MAPNYCSAYKNRGGARSAKGEFEKAIADFDEAIRLEPNFAAVYYNRACCYSLQGKPDQAIESLEQAFRLGYANFELLRKDPELNSIRDDPRFKNLVNKGK
jgi:tetratricopeptide (TPR) repeat protein